MAITYGFFDSVNGDRKYNADDISNYFLHLISDGVFATPANAMQVQENSGMTVQVSPGWGFLKCKWLHNDTNYLLTLDAADLALNRIDRIVMRLNPGSTARNIELAIRKGAPAGSPSAPALQRIDGGTWELSLARIYVAAGVSEITQADITDERPDTAVCGWVTGLIDQIDTTGLFAEYDSAFSAWFANVKEMLTSQTLVRQYSSRYTTAEATEDTIPINIPEYAWSLDVLNVYVNGMRLRQGTDYTLNGAAGTIRLTQALDVVGTPVDFQILKSIDGSEAESIVSLVYSLQQRVAALEGSMAEVDERFGGLSIVKCTDAEYEALDPPDDDTVYYIFGEGGGVKQAIGSAVLSSGAPAPSTKTIYGEPLTSIVGHAEQEES